MHSIEKSWIHFFKTVGEGSLEVLDYLGGLAFLSLHTTKVFFSHKFPLKAFIEACEFIGVKSLNLISLIAIFTGMVFALQFSIGLGRFGLKIYIGQVIGLAIVRELGPVLVSLMLAARVGAGIASELGSMVVTEQVMAIEALGADPVHKLVLPRLLAAMLMAPILTTVGNIVGLFGGMLVTMMEAGVTARFYFDQIRRTVEVNDYLSGITKTIFFGFFIGLIACYQGLKTTGGTEGVGRSTTQAVVLSSLMVFVSDFFLTKLFMLL